MQFQQQVVVHGIKESKGTFEGRAFDSCTFHVEADLKENASGRSLGRVTTPMKCGTSAEFDKWAHLGASFPIRANATFEVQATGKGDTALALVGIVPLERAAPAPKA